jgi:hypothetical protein
MQNYNLPYYFLLVWNLISHNMGRIKTEIFDYMELRRISAGKRE